MGKCLHVGGERERDDVAIGFVAGYGRHAKSATPLAESPARERRKVRLQAVLGLPLFWHVASAICRNKTIAFIIQISVTEYTQSSSQT